MQPKCSQDTTHAPHSQYKAKKQLSHKEDDQRYLAVYVKHRLAFLTEDHAQWLAVRKEHRPIGAHPKQSTLLNSIIPLGLVYPLRRSLQTQAAALEVNVYLVVGDG